MVRIARIYGTMIERDIELLFEIGSLRHIARTWHQFGGVMFSNVSEHCFRVAWLAMIIAQNEGADLGRVVLMALVHDMAETRTGDVNYISRMYVAQNDHDAVRHATAGTSLEAEIRHLWDEFEARETLESKIVKDADSLDCDLELAEKKEFAPGLIETLRPTREAVSEKLFTETARCIFRSIGTVNPHSWHITGRNRLTEGDWRRTLPPIQRELPLSAGRAVNEERNEEDDSPERRRDS